VPTPCLFCYNSAGSREHLWPAWIHARKKFGPIRHKIGARTEVILPNPEQKIGTVCGVCNNGWMSTLENNNIPINGSMFADISIPLDVAQQTAVAAWAVKTAMVVDSVRGRVATNRFYRKEECVAEHFHVRRTADNVGIIAPNWNVAPGAPQPVIRRSRDTGERELVMMRWGIVPWFAKTEDEFKALSTINAKSDQLTDSKMWREPFAKRRCLVPASGLYEWPKPGNAISPTYEPEPAIEEAGPGDLFGTAPKPVRKKKALKPIKRVFAITLTETGPFHSQASGTHGSVLMVHASRPSRSSRRSPTSSSPPSMIVSRSSCIHATTTAGWGFPRVAIRGLRLICCIPMTPTG
jgi:hypothetical protein